MYTIYIYTLYIQQQQQQQQQHFKKTLEKNTLTFQLSRFCCHFYASHKQFPQLNYHQRL